MTEKWDRRFLDLAEHVAGWSKDPSTKVGAVIANHRQVVSVGFNGLPSGVSDRQERLDDRDQRLALTIHAEENALAQAVETRGMTLYSTHAPCLNCAMRIIQGGIRRVVFDDPDRDYMERWGDSVEQATMFLEEAGITVEVLAAETRAYLDPMMAVTGLNCMDLVPEHHAAEILEAAQNSWFNRLRNNIPKFEVPK